MVRFDVDASVVQPARLLPELPNVELRQRGVRKRLYDDLHDHVLRQNIQDEQPLLPRPFRIQDTCHGVLPNGPDRERTEQFLIRKGGLTSGRLHFHNERRQYDFRGRFHFRPALKDIQKEIGSVLLDGETPDEGDQGVPVVGFLVQLRQEIAVRVVEPVEGNVTLRRRARSPSSMDIFRRVVTTTRYSGMYEFSSCMSEAA